MITRAAAATEHVSARLAALTPGPGNGQALAGGAAGIALLHIERAQAGHGSWRTAHTWVQAAVSGQISTADDTCLFYGAPAIAFLLHTGGARYRAAAVGLDAHVDEVANRRTDAALQRISDGRRPGFAEYDLLHGLTGIGAHLLAHRPGSEALGRILAYLVVLTRPLRADDGLALPGWWVPHDPQKGTSPRFSGGHANLGAAHGITGPLMLLAAAMRANVTVDGHADAITTITAFLDRWQQDSAAGPWWPQWLTAGDIRAGRPAQPGPARPSLCYGTPGIARAQQLAAIAIGDARRRALAERALIACLSDPAQLNQITDLSLCHGWAGVYQVAARTAADAATPALSTCLPRLADRLVDRLVDNATLWGSHGPGLLEGTAGAALALHNAAYTTTPISGWDRCLLIT